MPQSLYQSLTRKKREDLRQHRAQTAGLSLNTYTVQPTPDGPRYVATAIPLNATLADLQTSRGASGSRSSSRASTVIGTPRNSQDSFYGLTPAEKRTKEVQATQLGASYASNGYTAGQLTQAVKHGHEGSNLGQHALFQQNAMDAYNLPAMATRALDAAVTASPPHPAPATSARPRSAAGSTRATSAHAPTSARAQARGHHRVRTFFRNLLGRRGRRR